jgi:hypothetical protein
MQAVIITIHFSTGAVLHDGVAGAQARVDVRGAGGQGQDQEEAFHSASPSGLAFGRIEDDGTTVSSQMTL